MKTAVEMAREAGWTGYDSQDERFERLVELARADERKPLPPQSPCEMTQAEGKMFKLGWLECEAAHGIKGGSMTSEELTGWYPRSIAPVREGWYECVVRVTTSAPPFFYWLFWDGCRFRTPIPMVVRQWRGLTKQAAIRARGNT